MRYLFVFVTLVMVIAACTNKPLADGDGEVLTEAQARDKITSTSTWCATDADGDGTYVIDSFYQNSVGVHAIYDRQTSSYSSRDAMNWALKDDQLTRVLPAKYKPNVLVSKVRFLTTNGQTVMTLIDEDLETKQAFSACTPTHDTSLVGPVEGQE